MHPTIEIWHVRVPIVGTVAHLLMKFLEFVFHAFEEGVVTKLLPTSLMIVVPKYKLHRFGESLHRLSKFDLCHLLQLLFIPAF